MMLTNSSSYDFVNSFIIDKLSLMSSSHLSISSTQDLRLFILLIISFALSLSCQNVGS